MTKYDAISYMKKTHRERVSETDTIECKRNFDIDFMLWFRNIMWTQCKNACYCVKIPHSSAFKYNRMFNLSKRLQSLLWFSQFSNGDWTNESNGGRDKPSEKSRERQKCWYWAYISAIYLYYSWMLEHACNWHLQCMYWVKGIEIKRESGPNVDVKCWVWIWSTMGTT